ncbi:unnamed protein product [Toxocara canis]|uniref:TIP41-like protein n=1 Tax=Toxocara canis TaxID=6265 RepID=A0A183TZH8_TOXCA|nr:unnamed protein product [Toxocara canis]
MRHGSFFNVFTLQRSFHDSVCFFSLSQEPLFQVCEYNAKLSLPHLPEMVFPNNVLMIQHSSRPYIKLYFSALDALKMVDATTLPEVQVGPSAVWQQSRLGGAPVNQLLNRFDWTYSTDYQGTVEGFEIEATNEAIDMEKLKRRDPIHFYSQIALYEDELADHGCAQLSVRIRVMPACFFLLSRFYLRVDGVMVRICDTRIYGEHCSGYFIREWSKREAKFTELSSTLLESVLDSSAIWQHLPVVDFNRTKLTFPLD